MMLVCAFVCAIFFPESLACRDTVPPNALNQYILRHSIAHESFSSYSTRFFSPYTKAPIFCAIENRVAQHTGVPVKVRLGEAQAVEWLEGKGRMSWERSGRVVSPGQRDFSPLSGAWPGIPLQTGIRQDGQTREPGRREIPENLFRK